MAKRDNFGKNWIIQNAIEELRNYAPGELTVRGLHYRLVGRGMPNTMRHYKRVVSNMADARWDGDVEFYAFSDNERAMIGNTDYKETDVDEKIRSAKTQLRLWMRNYNKNRWENQPYYPEVFIEKKALQNLFQKPCDSMDVALGACKGHPSLTFLYDTAIRMNKARDEGKNPIILYFGDYDATGENIPETIVNNLSRLDCEVELKRILLMEDQVIEWNLPIAPSKSSDSRVAAWDGLGQVELDAVEPRELQRICEEAIREIFDYDLYADLIDQEESEREQYRDDLKFFVNNTLSD